MKKYKAKCKIDKNEGNGIEYYTIYIKEANEEADAHELAKHYVLTTFPQWSLFDIELTEI